MSEKNVVRPEKNPFEGIDVQKVYDIIAEICYITPARKRRAIRCLREWTSGLLGVCGFALLASWACGMDYSIWLRDQVMIWVGGAALIGLAYLVYPARPKKKKRPGERQLDQGAHEKTTP